MTAIYISEADIPSLITVGDAVEALDACFKDWPRAGKGNMPRGRAQQANGAFNLLGASYALKDVFGLKAYFGAPGGTRFRVMLYSAVSGDLLAMIEADRMGQMRTGAASGVATRVLAREDATSLAVIGTGRQAFAQAAAVAAVRDLRSIRVFSRNAQKRAAFAQRLEADLRIETKPAETAEACVTGADVVVTITKSAEPVCLGDWLSPGTHVNAAGANARSRHELDANVIRRAAIRSTDSVSQARLEAGEYCDLVAAGEIAWSDIRELGDIASGTIPGRESATQITLFKSLGIGIEDIAVAELVYQRATAAGIGRRMFAGD